MVWNNQKWNLFTVIIDVQTAYGIGYKIIANIMLITLFYVTPIWKLWKTEKFTKQQKKLSSFWRICKCSWELFTIFHRCNMMNTIMHLLYKAHELITYKRDGICMCIHMFHLKNWHVAFDEIWFLQSLQRVAAISIFVKTNIREVHSHYRSTLSLYSICLSIILHPFQQNVKEAYHNCVYHNKQCICV